MKWEELTWPRFAEAVEQVKGVCVVPLGVVESHEGHLPLGTDYLVVDSVAEKAAQLEPAIVFPSYWFAVFPGGLFQPGGINVGYEFAFDLLEDVCAEISRNGLKKIILLSGHGGNNVWLQDFLASTLERERDYVVYVAHSWLWYGFNDPEWKARMESVGGGHSCETETSFVLGTHPELVHMDEHRGDGTSRRIMDLGPGVGTPAMGYANFPDHYVGDGRPATREKGEWIVERAVRKVAAAIAAVKADTQTAELTRQFYRDAACPTSSGAHTERRQP